MRRRRLWIILSGLASLGLAVALVLGALGDNLTFFYSPSEITTRATSERGIRLGGLVSPGSVRREEGGTTIRFTVTDMKSSIEVVYTGLLPALFREGQGVVAEGRIGPDGVLRAQTILAKHDETYMPPEVKAALARADAPQTGLEQGSARP